MTVRVLVVDDSPTMRGLIAAKLGRDPEIELVGQAADPLEAREAIKRLNPDVITLDVEMPNMNGIDFLERLMRLRPTPVIMVSSLTQVGAEVSVRALEIGAFDCVAKPGAGDGHDFEHLAEKVKQAARSRRPQPMGAPKAVTPAADFTPNGRAVAIGASTGGVEALITVLSRFPANCPPTVVTQHMPPTFTRTFAERLDRLCAPHVAEAVDGAPLRQGHVYLAPGGQHLEVSNPHAPRCRLTLAERVSGHRPSVDVLFTSMSKVFGNRAVGVILTGMGRDGTDGLLAMRQARADTIGQDEASSIVYGMPRAAFEAGAVGQQASLGAIADRILHLAGTRRLETAR